MKDNRIRNHPILTYPDSQPTMFLWNGQEMIGFPHETIASALIANGIDIFGHHHKDGSPQGIFCANGQCAQCTVLVNGYAKKACMTYLEEGMDIFPLEHLPKANTSLKASLQNLYKDIVTINIPVMIIGGGPAGLAASVALGKLNIDTILVDDKEKLGGKLVLQTHRFFGSAKEVYAGHRGIEIAKILSEEVSRYETIHCWTSARVVGVFADKKVGVIQSDGQYILIKPKLLLIATGARENTLAFPGNTLPGVFGAGAFQTLVNRDLVRPSENVFIVGGGNVGLITGYHAMQAGINVKGLIEAMPNCGGYLVHEQKLRRLGVPILTGHTIISANGSTHVESITIAKCDEQFLPISGTEKTIRCDSILIAVGLHPVNEFYKKAKEFDMKVFAAGDAQEIAEASAAMISGKIAANNIAQELGYSSLIDSSNLNSLARVLKSKPGKTTHHKIQIEHPTVRPIIHCYQEIPCDPCSVVCPIHKISIPTENLLRPPEYLKSGLDCLNCEKCLITCPGLAITIIDTREDNDFAIVSIPFEFNIDRIKDQVVVTNEEGDPIYLAEVIAIKESKKRNHTKIVKVRVPIENAGEVAGIQLHSSVNDLDEQLLFSPKSIADETIICRCERVTAGEIRELIHQGVRDINQIKAVTRAGMGACGSKTCHDLIIRLFREEGIALDLVTDNTTRPLFYETDFATLAGLSSKAADPDGN